MFRDFDKFFGSAVAIAIFAISASAFNNAPQWLRHAASQPVQGYEKEVDAVVLLHERIVTVGENGKITTVERRALKILQREGKGDAFASAFYLSKFNQVKELEAWLIPPSGKVISYGKKETIDRISDPDDIYDEGRIKFINASGDADVGYVFGYTSTVEDEPLFYQSQWRFQDSHPTLHSRFVLELPKNWSATGVTFNHSNVAPQVSGSTYTWELRNLPPIAFEAMSPNFVNIVPRLAVNYQPADEIQGINKAFSNWTDVSRWATAMYEPQVKINEALIAKTRELTANAKTEFEKIQAIGRYVQNLQYISIDIGVGYGNGMRPRPSDLVFGRGYGDCKDKANLMRAMLKVLEIEAFPIAIYSGDRDYVRAAWVSPGQFNHCIIAVKVSAATTGPTVMEHPKLGRLLIFDATDPFTPVGDLPEELQGSYGLIMAGENGGLSEMPITPSDFNAWNRETVYSIDEKGNISGKMTERASGQESRSPRSMLRSVSADDFKKSIEGWLNRGATASKLESFSPRDDHDAAAFEMDIEFSARQYGQLMQDRLLVFKPAVTNRSNGISLTERSRKNPISFASNSFVEKARIGLPKGFEVDEMPEPMELTGPFGTYSTSYEVKDGELHYSRSFILKRTTIPASKYEEVRAFFTKIRDAEQSPVVLIKK